MAEQEVKKIFGERLRRRRMACGLTQKAFAVRVSMLPATVSRYEKGGYQAINFEKLRTIAEALGTTTDYLIGMKDDPGPVPERPCPGAEPSLAA